AEREPPRTAARCTPAPTIKPQSESTRSRFGKLPAGETQLLQPLMTAWLRRGGSWLSSRRSPRGNSARRSGELHRRLALRTGFRFLGFAFAAFSGLGIGTHQDCAAASSCCAFTAIRDASQAASVL